MTEPEKALEISQFRCQKCNAPYPLGADDVIATCPYCGFTFVIDGDEITNHFMVEDQLDQGRVREVVLEWLKFASSRCVSKDIVEELTIDSVTPQWIPTFRVVADYDEYHFGADQEKKGKQTVWRKKERREEGTCYEWVLSRRHAATFGVEEFIDSLSSISNLVNFDIKKTAASPVLNSEITDSDAPVRAEQGRRERVREELLEEVDKLFDYRLELDVQKCDYVHVPYWLVRYTHRKGTFRVALSGATGKVVLGELPVTRQYRVKKWLRGFALLATSAIMFQVLPYMIMLFIQMEADNEIWAVPVITAVLAGGFWIMSVLAVDDVLNYEVQVTAEGEERREDFSIFEKLKEFNKWR